jgi:transposase
MRRKYPADLEHPLVVTPLDPEAVRRWHKKAAILKRAGYSYREIAIEVGRDYSAVQRFLSPESGERQMRRRIERAKERRATDPEYDEWKRTYTRRYMQQRGKR